MPKPNTADHPEYFGRYINLVVENDLIEAFKNQSLLLPGFLRSVSEQKSMHAYAEGKWTIKELLQHITDAERIFSYRALCIARKEMASLPSFDENMYAENSHANSRDWQSLADEFINLRRSTEDLYNSFNAEMLWQKGISNESSINVLSLGFITVGHFTHHKKVIEERYL
ncbi:MAG: DinB family protein [Ginsengibacter sp.]